MNKPEHKTCLRGSELVNKDHPVIRLRGRVDSLAAKVLETGAALRGLGYEKAVADLEDVHAVCQTIMRCEVAEQPMPPLRLLGLDEQALRAHSHDPRRYYGLDHFLPTMEDSDAVIRLNALRCEVREVELAACQAFGGENREPARPDILRSLNRLSSAVYVMMLRAKSGAYL